MTNKIKIVRRFTPQQSLTLRQRRFRKAMKMFERYSKEEARCNRLAKKWGKKVRYYSRIFGA